MTKLSLCGLTVTFVFISLEGSDAVTIRNGGYGDKSYSHAIIGGNYVLLDGEETSLLRSGYVSLRIEVANPRRTIAQALGNDSVYVAGIDAVPEGREREILSAIMG